MKLILEEDKNITKIFLKNLKEWQEKIYRIVINEGGTGSSKTYSLAQLMALIMMKERATITIMRKTLPALKSTAMKDFFEWIKKIGIYREEWHNKSDLIYRYPKTKSEVDFISVDEPMRVRSRRRNYLWLNETNEFNREDYMQLSMRTDKQIFMDYNPSHQHHWIYDDIQTRKDCIVIPSTYKDNPFLPKELVKEIEGYKSKDKNYWRIYGLGLKGISEVLIYTHWQLCDDLPENYDKKIFGLDFGYNNQTAFLEIREKDKNYYWKEHLYQRYLTNKDLIRTEEEAKKEEKEIGKLHQLVKQGELSYTDIIYADNAEPARIEEIKSARFNILPCIKLSVKDGIDTIKSHEFFITKDSVNLQREVRIYSWRTKDDKQLEEPVKENDHLLDGGRYAIISEISYMSSAFPEQDRLKGKKVKPSSAGLMEREF